MTTKIKRLIKYYLFLLIERILPFTVLRTNNFSIAVPLYIKTIADIRIGKTRYVFGRKVKNIHDLKIELEK